MTGILVGLGIIVLANAVGWIADLIGGDENFWTRLAYAFSIGVLCGVIW